MLDKIFRSKIFLYIYTPVLFLLACAVTVNNKEVDGAVFFGYIAAFFLIFSSRLTDAMYPAMLLCVFVTRCYDSAALFIEKIPYCIPIVLAIIAHFIIYRRKWRIGRSFFGICAVALSVTLGGLGTISSSDYFGGSALYYVFGLGIGMILFYLLVKANFTEESGREVARIMYLMGLFACFCVLRFYFEAYDSMESLTQLVVFQSSNNLATFLMIAMPFPLFYASRRYFDVISVFLIYVCIFLTGSRGGLLMGTIEFVIIFVAFAVFDKRHLINRIFYMLIAISFTVAVLENLPELAAFYKFKIDSDGGESSILGYIAALKDYFFVDGEARVVLLDRMIEDFKANPVFGVGLGYTGNEDLYSPKDGAMNWYHMWFAQVIGGLGSLGIVCYGYQLIDRIIIFFKNMNLMNFTLIMSYMGLFIMSQVNPGEFCPMPYTALAVTFFAIMEKSENDITFPELGKRIKDRFTKTKKLFSK